MRITSGSSPLARGLPVRVDGEGGTRGIIPARAGFTSYVSRETDEHRDHPRSRGVYLGRSFHTPNPPGSSPLARGLLMGAGYAFEGMGIIPARAGFTYFGLLSAHDAGDHPRSRGVYETLHPATLTVLGSSPLARGLL